MITPDLTRTLKNDLKIAIGQLGYVLKQIDDENQAQNILIQLKAVEAIVKKVATGLLDETYRKSIAENISSAHQKCPGNCGNEVEIIQLLKSFPYLQTEEIPEKLKKAEEIKNSTAAFLSSKNLDTPPSD